MEIITSRQNNLFKHIKRLKEDKKYRKENKEFWVDGVNFVAQGKENNWVIKKLVYVPEELQSEFKKNIVEAVPAEKKVEFSKELYESLSSKKDIQGIGAIFEEKSFFNRVENETSIVLEHISNPGNLGTIMRTCVAFGIKNVVIVNPAVDPFSFEVVRSSMGAIFHLTISIFDSTEELVKTLEEQNIVSIGTSLQDDSIDIREYKNDLSLYALWFGNEAKGMSDEAKKCCKTLLHIPMTDKVDSFNISESVGITVWELVGKSIKN